MSKFTVTIPDGVSIDVVGGGKTVVMSVLSTVLRSPLVVLKAGIKGDKGADGDGAIATRFAWGDATPALITVATANKAVLGIEVIVLQAFDAPSNITVGDADNHQRLFDIPELDLSQVGTYQSSPNHVYGVATDINLYLTTGVGGSVGKGIVLIHSEA
jgi:hypothetical protein